MRPISSSITRSLAGIGTDRALPNARAEVDVLRQQLATGRRIVRPSDDPAGYQQARALGRVEQRLAVHERSLDAATLWTNRTQAELGALSELFSEANETALRAANGTGDAEALATQIDSIRDEVIGRLNATNGDEYLFAGNATRTAPVLPDGSITTEAIDGTRTREVAPGVTLTLNIPGEDAVYVDGVPAAEQLAALAEAIRTGDAEAITAGVAATRTAIDQYTDLEGKSGVVSERLDGARLAVEQQAIQTADARAAIEEIDLAEVLAALQRRQTGLEAALRATAAGAQQTLLDYL
ncbi:MAG: flagellin [Bacteroidota bacterium]